MPETRVCFVLPAKVFDFLVMNRDENLSAQNPVMAKATKNSEKEEEERKFKFKGKTVLFP